ncbi:MAG: hypothetical protein OEZ59_01065 [Deltaproteobacteria bacterium]|nr:hypothetical protein [Deltaproteobacteria bacterium]
MVATFPKLRLSASSPTFSIRGQYNSILMVMSGLGANPSSGRIMRGLSPLLDEQNVDHVFLLAERKRSEPWRGEEGPLVKYTELVHWERKNKSGVYRGVTQVNSGLTRDEVIQAFEYEPLHLIDWAARRMGVAVVSSDEPLRLIQLNIPKPWGSEGWFTGMEKRGVCVVRSTTGETELPYAIGIFPFPLLGDDKMPPILLKTLEPHPDPDYGDLYLEVHREKWETYIVLEVSREAWADGTGYLRAGLAPGKISEFQKQHGLKWEKELHKSMLAAIQSYEAVRKDIDSRMDKALKKKGLDPAEPVGMELLKELAAKIPKNLKETEVKKKRDVEAFLGRIPLREGDVVTLPPGVIHSLQHGVKVIEFQTPTYERLIAMFTQKVLTQPHWDTVEALKLMEKKHYTHKPPRLIQDEGGVRIEGIVDFPQFGVQRITLEQNTLFNQETAESNQYRLVYVIAGRGELLLPAGGVIQLEQGRGLIIPATMGKFIVSAQASSGLIYLEAVPTPKQKETQTKPGMKFSENGLMETW